MKQNVKVLVGILADATVAMAQDVNAEIQDVQVRATIDHKNNPNNEKTWQGYMVYFGECSDGKAHTIPISAGRLLSIQDEDNIPIFTEGDPRRESSVRGITSGSALRGNVVSFRTGTVVPVW